MVRPGRDRLGGAVEVDETYIGGSKPGKRGRGAAGKVLVLVAQEDETGLDVFVFVESRMLLQIAWKKQYQKWWCRAV
jgi:transposase-like protein